LHWKNVACNYCIEKTSLVVLKKKTAKEGVYVTPRCIITKIIPRMTLFCCIYKLCFLFYITIYRVRLVFSSLSLLTFHVNYIIVVPLNTSCKLHYCGSPTCNGKKKRRVFTVMALFGHRNLLLKYCHGLPVLWTQKSKHLTLFRFINSRLLSIL
jgi:hypothetical protein